MGRALCYLLMTVVAAAQPKEGDRVRVLVDLPADDSGADAPGGEAELVERVRKFGVGVAKGSVAAVTLVKRAGDRWEVHLNGGGFTNREWFALPGYDSPRWGTTKKEERLKSRVSGTRDREERRRRESDYNWERRKRVKPLRDAYERELRAKRGSRVKVRISDGATAAEWRELLRGVLELE